MEEKSQIDSLDKKILSLITSNARIPYLEVARECNVSGAAIHQRIQRLAKIGVITGSEFVINPRRLVLILVHTSVSFLIAQASIPKL